MPKTIARFRLILVAAISIYGAAVFAQPSAFKRTQLPYGISIEIPSHWTVLAEATRKNIEAAGSALAENSGIEKSGEEKYQLLAVNATPEPTGSMIRVSVTSPPYFTQADLESSTTADLNKLSTEMLNLLKKLEKSGGPRIFEMQSVRIEKFNGKLALVLPYLRESKFGPSPWQVVQYKIPTSNRLIEITLSHRLSDEIIWNPILERVKRSVRF